MKTLGIRTGKLYQSFGRNSNDSLTRVKRTDTTVNAIVGSKLPYANIQNVGGFIKATPILAERKSKKGKKFKVRTFKMSQYFWGMYKQHNNDFFKRMAMSVMKKGGVKIKPTRYFNKSLVFYEKKLLNPELEYILKMVLNAVNNDIDRAIKIAIDLLKDLATELPETFQIALAENLIYRSANNKFNNPKTVTWVD